MSKKPKSKNISKSKKAATYDTAAACIRYAVIYVLIALIVIIPFSIIIFSNCAPIVHRAQQSVGISANELVIDDSYEEVGVSEYLDSVKVGKLLGYITNEDAGINEKVYYGINRACLRNGVAMSSSSYLFGEGGCTRIAGYSSTSLNRLGDIPVGSVIKVQTYWGDFEYKVTDVYEADSVKTLPEEDSLLIAVNSGTKAFSVQNGNNIYVAAELVSKEVR